jgi:glycerophosphoryl diester phosphodiesterase
LVGDAASGDTGLLAAAHAEGLDVHIWTLRDDDIGDGFETITAELAFYLKLGVDGLFADFPDTALELRDGN